MYETAASLQDVCLNYICDNVEALCEVQTNLNDGRTSMVFRGDNADAAASAGEAPDIYFHSALSDQLLAGLSERNKLTDEVMTLFDPRVTSLKRVHMKDVQLTNRGLRMLKSHRITELKVTNLQTCTVNGLIGSLGEWTLLNLRALHVANCTFLDSAKVCVVVSLSKMRNLQILDVSNTEFNRHGLEIIAEDLPNLESVDISSTPVNDLSPLLKCKNRLKSLSMYNLRASHTADVVPVLCELHMLRHLDVSDDFSVQQFVNLQPVKFAVCDLLSAGAGDALPHLASLDISGKEGISDALLRGFVDAHPDLSFLGLALTDACEIPVLTEPKCKHMKVTGEATEGQILEALRRYSTRPVYVQKSLFHLFSITQVLGEPRKDVIEVILPAMKAHPGDLGVQMAATACLYNLSKGELGQKLHPSWLGRIVSLTMEAMHHFPNHQQLQKNALLTLCSDRILQDVNFDYFRCARLVMECLCGFEDSSMNRMSVAICSILAAKIPTEQTSQLGAKGSYMKKLLTIVREKKENGIADVTMRFTLSALWNLTDESPSTCDMFLNEGGLDLFLDVLRTYKDLGEEARTQVETKVLGLINNLAEVSSLRRNLMREDVLYAMRDSLKSQHIDVSYFAAGIISHLVTDGGDCWTCPNMTRQEMLQDLGDAVLGWEQPQGEMVAYRSFSPFFPLLTHFEAPQVQLWAVWAIQHVCSKNSGRYCPMLVSEQGSEMLVSLVRNPDTEANVKRLAQQVLDLVEQFSSKMNNNNTASAPSQNPPRASTEQS